MLITFQTIIFAGKTISVDKVRLGDFFFIQAVNGFILHLTGGFGKVPVSS